MTIIGTKLTLTLLRSSCFSQRSCTRYCICSKTAGLVFCNSSIARWENSRMVVSQYSRESMAPPGWDKSRTMQTAVEEMLKEANGACSKLDKTLPPPNTLPIVILTKFINIDFLFLLILDPRPISEVQCCSLLHVVFHRLIEELCDQRWLAGLFLSNENHCFVLRYACKG